METDCCSYELSKKLKELGFDEPCDYSYFIHVWMDKPKLVRACEAESEAENFDGTDIYDAIPLWQAQKWLRERAIEIVVTPMFSRGVRDGYDWDVYDDFSDYPAIRGTLPFAETYESALSAGLTAALELIKEKET